VSADLINLRHAKKNKARAESEKLAEANRQKFGRSKNEKNLASFEKSRDAEAHQGHKLDK
jgi:hypothetical protein